MRRPRTFWAWTLTLTAALLAVVWVGSMKMGVSMDSPKGLLGINSGRVHVVRGVPFSRVGTQVRVYFGDHWYARWWFMYSSEPFPLMGSKFIQWTIPLWPFVLLTGVPGVWMLIKTRKRTNPHACPACGYNRTGLPQTSTGPVPCPECGKN